MSPRSRRRDRAKYMAEWRAKKKAEGICLECPRPAARTVRCEFHEKQKAGRSKKLYERRKKAEKCVRCGAIPRRAKTLECLRCSESRGIDQSLRHRGRGRGWKPRKKDVVEPQPVGSMPWLD